MNVAPESAVDDPSTYWVDLSILAPTRSWVELDGAVSAGFILTICGARLYLAVRGLASGIPARARISVERRCLRAPRSGPVPWPLRASFAL
ncbi:hypothetical protein [Infirmifilum sp.]|uniref:hypothetical protein n=1 Tax=Infirmifilum sp. TaxID=2856575 RepID=UPI003D0A11B8